MLDNMLPNTLPEPEHIVAVLEHIVAVLEHIVVVVDVAGSMVVQNVREQAS